MYVKDFPYVYKSLVYSFKGLARSLQGVAFFLDDLANSCECLVYSSEHCFNGDYFLNYAVVGGTFLTLA